MEREGRKRTKWRKKGHKVKICRIGLCNLLSSSILLSKKGRTFRQMIWRKILHSNQLLGDDATDANPSYASTQEPRFPRLVSCDTLARQGLINEAQQTPNLC